MKNSNKQRQGALIVLGMHRSGTSALMRVLNLHGIDIGNDLMPPKQDNNVTGFWEHEGIYRIHEELLEALDSSWDDVRPLPDRWWLSDTAQRYKMEIIRILKKDFSDSAFWGIKDPRLCRLMPLWHTIFKQIDVRVYYLIITRNPLEVAQSLTKRDAFPKGKSCLLWLAHLLEAEYETRGAPRIFLTYEDLLSDWKGVMNRAQKKFGINFPINSEENNHEVNVFLNSRLRHCKSTDSLLARNRDLFKWIREAYFTVTNSTSNDERLRDNLTDIRNEYNGALGLFTPVLDELWDKYRDGVGYHPSLVGKLQDQTEALEQEVHASKKLYRDQEQELNRMHNILKEKEQQIERLTIEKDEQIERLTIEKDEQIERLTIEKDELINQLVAGMEQLRNAVLARRTSARIRKIGRKFVNATYRFNNSYRLIKKSGLFDAAYYFAQNTDVASSGWNPIVHYIKYGANEGRNPNPGFNSSDYLQQNPDVEESGTNPLVYYLETDRKYSPSNNTMSLTLPLNNLFEEEKIPVALETDIKMIAFYLPQFHPIPENDAWWGKGFTEWRNVTKAKPLFTGHYQPRLPGDLGFYDLRIKEVQQRQIELARAHGLYGFCYHYYWFNGKRLLERPLNQVLSDPNIDFPFCICWANENWTRRWDGRENNVLIAQRHSSEQDLAFIKDVAPILKDERYIRVNDKPLLIVYKPHLFPNPRKTLIKWREYCVNAGVGDVFFAHVQTDFGQKDPRKLGYDASIQFPPHNVSVQKVDRAIPDLTSDFNGLIYSYSHLVEAEKNKSKPPYKQFRGIMPDWDNTARRGKQSHMAYGASPKLYKDWLSHLCKYSKENLPPEERFIFVNAWNEWAEGTYLEPDNKYGYAYLNKTSEVLSAFPKNAENPAKWKILFVSHDAHSAGAQKVLFNTIAWFKAHTTIDIKVLCLDGGELIGRFQQLGDTYVLSASDWTASSRQPLIAKIEDFCGGKPDLIYGNSVAAGKIYKVLRKLNAPIITHIHELEMSIKRYAADYIEDVIGHTSHFIACSSAVKENLVRTHKVDPSMIDVVYSSIESDRDLLLVKNKKKRQLRKKLGLKEKKHLVFGCGIGMAFRKGADLFIETARALRSKDCDNFHFYWIGGFDKNENDSRYGRWGDILKGLKSTDLREHISFLGFKKNPREYLMTGDIFLLPSREDPFPLVALEAAECGMPTICFIDAGGMPDFVEEDAGFVVPHEDIDAMAEKTALLIEDATLRKSMGARAREKLLSNYTYEHTIPQTFSVCRRVAEKKPAVSVIVPNFNHAPYLPERLESIFSQTLQDMEIILLDDASTDDSVRILKKYANRPDVRLLKNRKNSVAPFKQWLKGINHSKADIIWIAESDDICKPEFLETLLPAFKDPEVKLAYANSHIIDERGDLKGDYLETEYLTSLSKTKWRNNYKVTSEIEINQALGIKNTILNASAALFRKADIEDAVRSDIEDMRFAGDWLFIVNTIRDGSIYYDARKLNYHRRHSQSVIGKILADKGELKRFFNEIAVIHKFILKNYRLAVNFSEKWDIYLRHQWHDFFPSKPFEEFETYYPYRELKNAIIAKIEGH